MLDHILTTSPDLAEAVARTPHDGDCPVCHCTHNESAAPRLSLRLRGFGDAGASRMALYAAVGGCVRTLVRMKTAGPPTCEDGDALIAASARAIP